MTATIFGEASPPSLIRGSATRSGARHATNAGRGAGSRIACAATLATMINRAHLIAAIAICGRLPPPLSRT
eukprot:scaffold141713_cov32-Tisochrysis_lutea.AAC.2